MLIVTQASSGQAPRSQKARRGKPPVAIASQAAPAGKRTRHVLLYRCPWCECQHIGFSKIKLTSCKRISGCGRVIFLVVKRNYKGDHDKAGVA